MSATRPISYIIGPAPLLRAALNKQFFLWGETEFADKMLSALRFAFGGHEENATAQKVGTE